MANKKINDLAAAGAVSDTMQYETDIGGATANKVTSTQVKTYVQTGITGGKTVEGGTAASENLILDSTSNATKGEVQIATGSDLKVEEKVITDMLTEKTLDNGIDISVSGNTGKLYDYTNTWFSFSGSGTPDIGTDIYLPYTSSDGIWLGYGMASTDLISMGTGVADFVCTGDGKVTINSLSLRTQATPPTSINGTIYYDTGDTEFKFRENGVWHTLAETGVDEFSELTDVTGAYTTANALYRVNNTTDGLEEIAILVAIAGPDLFNISTGSTTLTVGTTVLLNQDLSTTSSPTFDDLTLTGKKIESGAAPATYLATETITGDETNHPVAGNGGAVTLTSNPQIALGTDNETKRLIGTNDTNTLTVVDGNGLALDNGQSFTLGENDIIEFIFYNSLWLEISRKDN